LTELTGDIKLTCTGGVPTAPGAVVPQMDILVSLNSNITSKITANLNSGFTTMNEALLLMDEPNSTNWNNGAHGIRNCGYSGEDTGPSGPGVCSIVAGATPDRTYDGSGQMYSGGRDVTCDGIAYSCTRPNVFQGRQATSLLANQPNVVQFLGVPYDPPANGSARTVRITNIRIDATRFGVASPFTTVPVIATISISGNTAVALLNTSVQVGQVQQGLSSKNYPSSFLQCVSDDANHPSGGSPNGKLPVGIHPGSGVGMDIRIQENFPTAFKVRNVIQTIENGNLVNSTDYQWNGGIVVDPIDLNQNETGNVVYNNETGFMNNGGYGNSAGNPPTGFGSPVQGSPTNLAFRNVGTDTGFRKVGSATNGSRLAVTMDAPLAGTSVYVPLTVTLYNQSTGLPTGVLVLTNTDNNGAGAFSAATAASTTGPLTSYAALPSNNIAVYEVAFSNPLAMEYADIEPVLVYTANIGSNLPAPGSVNASVSFAPFYATGGNLPSSTLAIPRFIPTGTPSLLYTMSKCQCNLLFPWVVGDSSAGYVTSIVVANTAMDPFGTGTNFGAVNFFYYGTKGVSLDPSATGTFASQKSTVTVPAGSYIATIVTNAAAGNTAANGLKAMTGPFAGYVIAQADFQYCHGIASISGVGLSPQTYLGLQLDTDLGYLGSRSGQSSESLAH
jgi:hypothetical protein